MAQRVRIPYRGRASFVCHTTPHSGSTSRRVSYSVRHHYTGKGRICKVLFFEKGNYFCKAEDFVPEAVCFRRRKPQERAWVGQAWTQSPQRMHSALLGFRLGSMPIRQTRAHFPQETHLSLSRSLR